jgi:hypothetical protein
MKRENILTVIGLSLPVILILAIALYVFLANKIPNPSQDFIFTIEEYDPCITYEQTIVVDKNGSMHLEKIDHTTQYPGTKENPTYAYEPCQSKVKVEKKVADVYRYHFANNSVERVSTDDLLNLQIQTGTSPEGYAVDFGRQYSGPFLPDVFMGSTLDGIYLHKNNKQRKLEINSVELNAIPYNFKIIGWIINQKTK